MTLHVFSALAPSQTWQWARPRLPRSMHAVMPSKPTTWQRWPRLCAWVRTPLRSDGLLRREPATLHELVPVKPGALQLYACTQAFRWVTTSLCLAYAALGALLMRGTLVMHASVELPCSPHSSYPVVLGLSRLASRLIYCINKMDWYDRVLGCSLTVRGYRATHFSSQ